MSHHQSIFEVLRREILLGKFNMHERFLSEQQLCRRFSVARATVRLALARLKDAGMLETRSGSGTYLSAMVRNATGRLGMIVPGIASGEIFPPLCAEIVRVARENGYEVRFGDASSRDPERRAQQAIELAHRYIGEHVAGVFLEPIELVPDAPRVTGRIIKVLSESRIPVVLLDRDIVSPPERSPYDLVGL
ncbi:MAG: GntR family transcriptional regulator, partial [Kiritimatiellae bacterium]|nr:GntR family transcriptional regulator [Kiritimatiellia bacterium]